MMTFLRPYMFVMIAAALIATGCNEPFSPKGPFHQHFVAYSILNTGSDTQYVRLAVNYNPPDNNPSDVPVNVYDTTAQVVIASATQSYVFHDTLLAPSLHAFVNSSFRPIAGIAYNLTAVSQRGTITAHTTVPSQGNLGVANQSTLFYPGTFSTGYIEVLGRLGESTKGFLVRFVLTYSLASDTAFHGEIEIPFSYQQNAAGASVPVYPQLQRNTDPLPVVNISVSSYLQVITELTNQYSTKIVPKLAEFYLVQVDESLYDYYNIANGFRDPYSIRTDQPDYTNIQNGLGVFGSFTVDSVVIRY